MLFHPKQQKKIIFIFLRPNYFYFLIAEVAVAWKKASREIKDCKNLRNIFRHIFSSVRQCVHVKYFVLFKDTLRLR